MNATLVIREEGAGTRAVVLTALERAGISFGRLMLFGTTEASKQVVIEGLGVPDDHSAANARSPRSARTAARSRS